MSDQGPAEESADPEARDAEARTPEAGTPDQPPAADGLDLARSAARAAAGAATTPARRRRSSGPATGTGAAGRRGRPGSGSHPDERDPQLVASSLSRLVEDHGWALDLRIRSVFARWEELVGEEVAAHATPEAFDDGRLVVRAGSTAWATQLRLLAPTLLRRLAEELGPGIVTVVEVLGPHRPAWTRGRLSTRDSRGPRDTYG